MDRRVCEKGWCRRWVWRRSKGKRGKNKQDKDKQDKDKGRQDKDFLKNGTGIRIRSFANTGIRTSYRCIWIAPWRKGSRVIA